MIYKIDASVGFDEGGSAEFYNIFQHDNLGFKQFHDKSKAINAFKKQKLLSKFHLAPKIIGKVCKLPILINGVDTETKTNYGFITEKAIVIDENIMRKRMHQIQRLVESIQKKTGLEFWDCHYYNVGYVKRKNKAKLVCIDTGNESFLRDSNAWGMNSPGPFCRSCEHFHCECSIY